MRLIITFGLYLVFAPLFLSAQAQTAAMLTFSNPSGPYQVGLKVVEQYDFSRIFESTSTGANDHAEQETSRPLQTLIWYPAVTSRSKPMTVADYKNVLPTETSFEKPTMSLKGNEWIAGFGSALNQPLRAVHDALPVAHRFPVIIYAPSFSSVSWENADLCEYLASFGYVVIATPAMGASTRAMTHDLSSIDAQARDISFLLGYARTLHDADVSEVGVAAFSWGGISNLFAAARDSRIKALADLDGSMRYFPGLVKAGDVHPEMMTIPLLFFRRQTSLEDQAAASDPPKTEGPNVLNAWTHGDLITVHMLGLVHPEFSSMAQRNEQFWKDDFARMQLDDYNREDGTIGYQWTATYTLNFFDAYLKQNAAALDYLKKTSAQNGVPEHVLSVHFRPHS